MLPRRKSSGVGSAIRAARERAGLPLLRVARAAGLTLADLRGIESGRTPVTVATLARIAQALGVRPVDLVRGPSAAAPERDAEQALPGLAEIAKAIALLPASVGSKLDAAEQAAVVHALGVCDGNQSAAARLLGMERKALVRRMKRARPMRRKGRGA